jgi:hypothetical protein
LLAKSNISGCVELKEAPLKKECLYQNAFY